MRWFFLSLVSFVFLYLPVAAQEVIPSEIGKIESVDPVINDQPLTPKELFALEKIVVPPQVKYPQLALLFGASGRCVVNHGIAQDGTTKDILAACSNWVFCTSAIRAIEAVRYDPAAVQSGQLQVNNIHYPIVYVLDGHNKDRVSGLGVNRCNAASADIS